MSIEQLDAVDLMRLKKHTGREAYAAACVAQRCFAGLRVVSTLPTPARSGMTRARSVHPRADTVNVYTIDGFDGELLGLEAVCCRLYDLGVKASRAAMTMAVRQGREIGGYHVRTTGETRYVGRKSSPAFMGVC